MNIGYPAPSASYMPFFSGVDSGVFRKAGFDVSMKLLAGSSSETAALVSGSVQMAIADSNAILAAMGKGVKTVLVGTEMIGIPAQVLAAPQFKTLASLDGHKLGLKHVASLTDTAAREFLPPAGLDMSKVQVVYLADAALAGLIDHKVDAAVLTAPDMFTAKDHGLHVLFDFSHSRHAGENFVFLQSFVQAHPQEVVNFLKAYTEAAAYTKNPANRAAVTATLGRFTKTTDPSILKQTYDYHAPLFRCNATLVPDDLADAAAWVKANDHVTVDPTKAIDAAPMQSLVKSGFVAKTCGKSS